jgi:NAD(P)-dependent dehydrogenase (short-subunit alcohol dehydrogenase family)
MAQALADRGMTVALHYHQSEAGARELAGQIEAAGGHAACFRADLTDPHAAESLPSTVAARLGGLHVLVNSAAVMHRLSLEDTTPEQWDAILGLNLRSVFFCTRGAAAALRQSRGKVVNLADLAGLEPWPGFAAHSISKAGVVMLTKVLARSLAPDVTVNAIAPGADEYSAEDRERLVRSTPLRRLGSPADVVAALLYLLEGGDYVTGEILVVDGGRLVQ